MTITFEIQRRKSAQDRPYIQELTLETEDTTVAEALDIMNAGELADDPIQWECSCKQKKCGACAMLINGKPRLACDARLSEFPKGVVELAPLKKFPTVCDLVVDRSMMYDDLKTLGAWFKGDAVHDETGIAYDASRCLQCGCCLEVCPNFYAGGEFFGAAALAPASRLISEADKTDGKRLQTAYNEHFYKGCGKSLSCKNVCPAGIDTERLLVRSNAVAVWKRKKRK
jgi:succinate dehydrogenase / fumarate reductase iron-sulfur subunit